MQRTKKYIALLLAVTLALALAACGGNSGKEAPALKARFTSLIETDAIEEIMADPAQHADEIAAYGLDDFAKTFAQVDTFRSYTVEISLQNESDSAVQVMSVQMETENQGKDGVWFAAGNESAAIGLPAHYTGDEALYYYVIATAALSRDDVLRKLGEMGISCVYLEGNEAPDMNAQIDPALLHTAEILCKE